MTTARKYYFKPDAETQALLPGLFRISNEQVNYLIHSNLDFCKTLREKRLQDPVTREAQLELDELRRLGEEIYEAVKEEDEPLLNKLRGQRWSVSPANTKGSPDAQKYSELHIAYSNLKKSAKEKRKRRMKSFNEQVSERRAEAYKIVNKANQKDYSAGWGDAVKSTKKMYSAETKQKQKYHMDHYNRHGLTQARKKLGPDEAMKSRKFVRGYATNLPESGSIATGQGQAGQKEDKTITVAEYRMGKTGKGFVRTLAFPDPSAWDPRLPKGERKRKQLGKVEISLLGCTVSGTSLFHQALPDDHCIVGAGLSVEVRSGNTYYYLTLTAMPRSEMGKKDFSALQDFFEELTVDDLSVEGLKEAFKMLSSYKGHLTRKKIDLTEVNAKLEQLRSRRALLKEMGK
jgi:hypothetical protein